MIEVLANGKKFAGWTSVTISRTIESISGSFSLELSTGRPGYSAVGLFPGDSVQIFSDGILALVGYVEKISASFGASAHKISVTGRETTCDLVDCAVESPLEWKRKKADAIISDILSKYGIPFYNAYGVNVGAELSTFAIDPGTKAIDAIAKLCKERGFLACSNGFGSVFLFDPSAAVRGPTLRQGQNLLSASAEVSLSGRFSAYKVFGSGSPKKKVVGEASDSEVGRYRPFVAVDANATEKESTQARADWECEIRRAKSVNYRCTVPGWFRSPESIWSPGIVCKVEAPAIFAGNGVDLLVSSVGLSFGSGGSIANLGLCSRDAFTPQPETKKKQGQKTKAKSVDVWAGIRKAVRK